MKQERTALAPADAWAAPALDDRADLSQQIMNMMEQGILVWNADGVCALHNTRIFQVVEMGAGDLSVGTTKDEFRERALARGEVSPKDLEASDRQIAIRAPYAYDRRLPSGRVILTNGRPSRGGGYVVTFTDVTAERRAAQELKEAKHAAEAAEARAMAVLGQERARQAEGRLLAQLDEWLQSAKSLGELYMIVRAFMLRLLPGSAGELYIYSNSRDALEGVCQWDTAAMHAHIAPDSCWALRRGRAYEYDASGLCFVCDHVDAQANDGAPVAAEYICVPIVAHGDTVGLLHIRFGRAGARIESHAAFARRCGEHISMAVANAKLRDALRDQSIRDPLTGLYNRRFFLEAMRREIALSARTGASFGLVSFDADRFKTFNDNHGHDAGDMVLRTIGAKMGEVASGGEVACRFGGEEFMLLVPSAGLAQAAALAERLRDAIAATQVRYVDGILPGVTISAGVAAYPATATSPQELLRLADEALYRAKSGGRNRVEVAG